MKFFAAFLLFAMPIFASYAQDVNSLLKEADRLEATPDEKAALTEFRQVLRVQPSNLYALTKSSELCARIGGREKQNLAVRDDYYNASIIYAKTALRLYPQTDAANVAMAIAVGRTILLKSGREKVSAVRELKGYADKAIAENPNNFKAWHVLGKWNYEVSDLNAFERACARLMYGGLPPASLAQSIVCYEKAKALNPTFALNYLELAKAYKRNDQDKAANDQLNFLLTLRNQTEDDPRIKAEARELLTSWN